MQKAYNINSPALVKKVVKLGYDPKTDGSHALRWALKNRHFELAEFLIPVSNVKVWDSFIPRISCEKNNLRVLIDMEEPKLSNI
jgi:hypothetical protein